MTLTEDGMQQGDSPAVTSSSSSGSSVSMEEMQLAGGSRSTGCGTDRFRSRAGKYVSVLVSIPCKGKCLRADGAQATPFLLVNRS